MGGATNVNSSLSGLVNTGARYNPVLNTWTPVTTNGAPSPTRTTSAVWTGQEMVVLTGVGSPGAGGRYNPVADRWDPVSRTNAPIARQSSGLVVSPAVTAVWTGREVFVWGNVSPYAGGRYSPLTDTWTTMTSVGNPKNRSGHAAVWTGEGMLVFGGMEASSTLPDSTLLYTLTRPLYLYGPP